MNDDPSLLRRYVQEESNEAFAELVRRHVDFVYAAALRQLRSSHRAEEVTQVVFTDLARKAPALCGRSDLLGWLYLSTRYAALRLKRGEVRRGEREQEAHMIAITLEDGGEPHWENLAPVLDAALGELGESDREALLLRFFKDRPFADVGQVLGVTEEAAKKRVQRALEKLRPILARKGVTSTAAGLAFALTHQAAVAAPSELSATVTASALQAAAAGTVGAGLLAGWSQWIGAGKVAAVAVALFTAGAVYLNREKVTVVTSSTATAETGSTSRAGDSRANSGAVMAVVADPPGPTLAEILAEPDELRSVSLYARHLLQLPVGEFAAVFERILDVTRPEQKLSFLNLLLQRWGQVDPRGALEHLTTLQGQSVGTVGIIGAAQIMQYKNWALAGWATVHPVEALDWVISNPGDFNWAADLNLRSLMPSPGAARNTREAQIDNYQRTRITGMIGALAANGQYSDAATMLTRSALDPKNLLVADTTKSLMAAWVAADGTAAAAWLPTGLPAGPLRKAAYAGFVQAVADAEIDIATKFVRSLTDRDDIDAAGSGIIASFRARGDTNGGYQWLRDNIGENSTGAYDNAVYELFAADRRTRSYGTGLDGESARVIIARIHDDLMRKRAAGTYVQFTTGSPGDAIQAILQFYSEEERWAGVTVPASAVNPGLNGLMSIGTSLPAFVSGWARRDRGAAVAYINGLTSLSESDRARLLTVIGSQ